MMDVFYYNWNLVEGLHKDHENFLDVALDRYSER